MKHPQAAMEAIEDGRILRCQGVWDIEGISALPSQLTITISPHIPLICIETNQIIKMDTTGALHLLQLINSLEKAGKKITIQGLKKEHQLVLDLVRKQFTDINIIPSPATHENGLVWIGRWALTKWQNAILFCAFLGELIFYFFRINYRDLKDLLQSCLKTIETAGCDALPLVGLMSFLVGLVLAYELGVQLKLYGADIYVVDATGMAILREFSPLMTAVIVSARTSTAFAALLGAMKVNEEIDALNTMGIPAIKKLVLPRIIGVIIVLPLLVVWSSLFSIWGSMVMTGFQSHIGYLAFLNRFETEVGLQEYVLGMVKTPIFAFILSAVGCFQGLQVGVTADSIGVKTTAAAVQSIFLIIIADAFFSVIFSWYGL
jgi:phospholipid/cholesterol/gamma-HCH transport system permease protein